MPSHHSRGRRPPEPPDRATTRQSTASGPSRNSSAVRIFLVEDHTIFREALRSLLTLDAGIQVVGEAGNGLEALRLIPAVHPMIVVVDLALPGLHGLELIREIRHLDPKIKIIVLTFHCTDIYVRTALEAGASAYLAKDASHAELCLAIQSVLDHKTYISPTVSAYVVAGFLSGGNEARQQSSIWTLLSQREREVLKLIAEGRRNKEIAACLCISVRTVEKHRASLAGKLKLHTTAAMTAFAIEQGLVTGVVPPSLPAPADSNAKDSPDHASSASLSNIPPTRRSA